MRSKSPDVRTTYGALCGDYGELGWVEIVPRSLRCGPPFARQAQGKQEARPFGRDDSWWRGVSRWSVTAEIGVIDLMGDEVKIPTRKSDVWGTRRPVCNVAHC